MLISWYHKINIRLFREKCYYIDRVYFLETRNGRRTMKEKITWKDLYVLVVGMFIVSIAVYYFLMPGKLAIGSMSGFLVVLSNFVPLPMSVLTFIALFFISIYQRPGIFVLCYFVVLFGGILYQNKLNSYES